MQADSIEDVKALLAHRTKPLAIYSPSERSMSIASKPSSTYSVHSIESARQSVASSIVDPDHSPTISGSPPLERLSALGPKIHKNGLAPWEIDDNLPPLTEARGSEDTTAESVHSSIWGRRARQKPKEKPQPTVKVKGRDRSRTLVETISPVTALKGLGFNLNSGATLSQSPAPSIHSSTRSMTPDAHRPSMPDSFMSSSSSADDDAVSVTASALIDANSSFRSGPSEDRADLHLPPQPRRSEGRSRAKTVSHMSGTIDIELGRGSSDSSLSSANPLPTPRKPRRPSPPSRLQRSAPEIPSIRAEDMFRTSVASQSDAGSMRGKMQSTGHLHPFSNPDLHRIITNQASAFSSDSSPSPLDTSPMYSHSPSVQSFGDVPSPLSPYASAASLDVRSSSRSPQPPKVARKKAPPPPLTIHNSPSMASLSSARRIFAKGLSKGSTPREDVNSDMFEIDPRSKSSLFEGLGVPSPGLSPNVSTHTLPLAKSGLASPAPHGSFPPSPAAPQSRSRYSKRPQISNPTPIAPSPMNSMFASPIPLSAAEDLPPGMLTFPGSQAYQLISLEEAQEKQRDRARPNHQEGNATTSRRSQKEATGIGSIVSKIRMNSEPTSSSSAAAGPSSTVSLPQSMTESAPAPATVKPALRQRKSGLLRLWPGSDKNSNSSSGPTPTGSTWPRTHGESAPTTPVLGRADDPWDFVPPVPKLPAGSRDASPRPDISRAQPHQVHVTHPTPDLGGEAFSRFTQRAVSAGNTMTSSSTSSTITDDAASYQTASAESHKIATSSVYSRKSSIPFSSKLAPITAPEPMTVDKAGSPESQKEPILRLRHMSTINLFQTLPQDYLSQQPLSAVSAASSDHTPSLSPATPSFKGNNVSSLYSCSDASSSPLPTPNSTNLLSPPYGRNQYPVQGLSSEADMVAALQEQLAATKKQARNHAYELERQIKDLKGQVERLQLERSIMMCSECGSCDVVSRRGDSIDNGNDSTSSSGDHVGVVNRPRAPTGGGTRFGSRLV